MATANFWTMRNFDLWAVLEEDETLDDDYYFFAWNEIEHQLHLNDVNDGLMFHKISLKTGYYSGLQIYVEEADNPHEMDNDSTRYYFDLPRSVAIRKYDAEIRKIRRWMEKELPPLGFVKLRILARFSNGEVWYTAA